MTTLSRPSVFMLEFSGQLTTPDRFSYHTGKGDIAAIDSAQDQTLHQMTSRVLRERPRNRPHPVSTGILPHSLPEWAFRARPGLWRNCLCPKVARIAEQKFCSR